MKLSNILERGAAQFASDPCTAVQLPKETLVLTYHSAWQALLEHEAWIQHNVAMNTKIVVAYLSGNSIDLMLSMLACMNVDHVTVALLNTRWTPGEMASALQTRGPSAKTLILYGPGFEESAWRASNLLSHPSWTLAIPAVSETRMTKRSTAIPYPSTRCYNNHEIDNAIQEIAESQDGDQDAVVVFTSGTTSGSKGVRLSHRALCVQAIAKLRKPCRYSRQTRMLASTVPLFHVGGLSSTLSVFLAGGTWILPSSGSSFDPTSVLKSVSSLLLPANTLVVVPAMLHSILQQASGTDSSYDSVRLLLIGGQSASPETLRHIARIFPNARVVQTFACTEAASSLTFLDVQHNYPESMTVSLPSGPNGDCVGVPPPHIELVLINKDNERNVQIHQPHQVGIFATRGPHVMSGYWKRDVDNESLSQDSWYITNDLGFHDEHGRFYFCGRTKDIIRTGGESVIALEVERVLLDHPDIQECAVFALPDERFGEAVCAALVSKNEALTLSYLRHFCTEQGLAGYKKPRAAFFMKQLPRNSSGKVQKHKLVERFRERQLLLSKL